MLALLSYADGVVGCDFGLILYSKYEQKLLERVDFIRKSKRCVSRKDT
jgi:hypothetical protein